MREGIMAGIRKLLLHQDGKSNLREVQNYFTAVTNKFWTEAIQTQFLQKHYRLRGIEHLNETYEPKPILKHIMGIIWVKMTKPPEGGYLQYINHWYRTLKVANPTRLHKLN